MGSQDEQANLATSIVNSALQNVSNYCTISCQEDVSNTDIVIIGGNATIDIGGTCSIVGSECVVKTVLSSSISNMIDNTVQQQEDNLGIYSLLGPSSNESTDISSAIKNQVSQLISNTCSTGVNDQITNTNVFAQDANLKLTIGQTGTVSKASCALDTVAKLVLNNSVTNSVKQTESSCGSILWILIVAVIIALLVLMWPLLSAVFSVAGKGVRAAGRIIPAENKNKRQ